MGFLAPMLLLLTPAVSGLVGLCCCRPRTTTQDCAAAELPFKFKVWPHQRYNHICCKGYRSPWRRYCPTSHPSDFNKKPLVSFFPSDDIVVLEGGGDDACIRLTSDLHLS